MRRRQTTRLPMGMRRSHQSKPSTEPQHHDVLKVDATGGLPGRTQRVCRTGAASGGKIQLRYQSDCSHGGTDDGTDGGSDVAIGQARTFALIDTGFASDCKDLMYWNSEA